MSATNFNSKYGGTQSQAILVPWLVVVAVLIGLVTTFFLHKSLQTNSSAGLPDIWRGRREKYTYNIGAIDAVGATQRGYQKVTRWHHEASTLESNNL